MSGEGPRGELAIQMLAMPAHTNPNGDIFGGWLLSAMDLAGGVIAEKRSRGRVVTVAVDSMVFKRPVRVGDLVCCYGELLRVGRTSMTIRIEVWSISHIDDSRHRVTEGVFVYVAIDGRGDKRAVDG